MPVPAVLKHNQPSTPHRACPLQPVEGPEQARKAVPANPAQWTSACFCSHRQAPINARWGGLWEASMSVRSDRQGRPILLAADQLSPERQRWGG